MHSGLRREFRIFPALLDDASMADDDDRLAALWGHWGRLGAHGQAGTPPERMPVLACLIMEDADDDARAAFLAPMPPEVRDLATGPWQEGYARYVAVLRGS